LNLYEGQVLNWDLVQDTAEGFTYIRVYTGSYATRLDQLACQEARARAERKARKKRTPRARKIRKSEARMESRGQRLEMIKSSNLYDAGELQEIIGGMVEYLQGLAGRIKREIDERPHFLDRLDE